jgi:hypothetical protein
MLTTLTGYIFLGWGRQIHCGHCGNDTVEEIVGWTREGGICGIPFRSMTSTGNATARCPICHRASPRPMTPELKDMLRVREQVRRKAEETGKMTVVEEFIINRDPREFCSDEFIRLCVEAGKEKTRDCYRRLGWAQKKLHLGRLRRFGFNELADFISS